MLLAEGILSEYYGARGAYEAPRINRRGSVVTFCERGASRVAT